MVVVLPAKPIRWLPHTLAWAVFADNRYMRPNHQSPSEVTTLRVAVDSHNCDGPTSAKRRVAMTLEQLAGKRRGCLWTRHGRAAPLEPVSRECRLQGRKKSVIWMIWCVARRNVTATGYPTSWTREAEQTSTGSACIRATVTGAGVMQSHMIRKFMPFFESKPSRAHCVAPGFWACAARAQEELVAAGAAPHQDMPNNSCSPASHPSFLSHTPSK